MIIYVNIFMFKNEDLTRQTSAQSVILYIFYKKDMTLLLFKSDLCCLCLFTLLKQRHCMKKDLLLIKKMCEHKCHISLNNKNKTVQQLYNYLYNYTNVRLWSLLDAVSC